MGFSYHLKRYKLSIIWRLYAIITPYDFGLSSFWWDKWTFYCLKILQIQELYRATKDAVSLAQVWFKLMKVSIFVFESCDHSIDLMWVVLFFFYPILLLQNFLFVIEICPNLNLDFDLDLVMVDLSHLRIYEYNTILLSTKFCVQRW